MFCASSWFAFMNILGGYTDKHERARYVCSSRRNDIENQWECNKVSNRTSDLVIPFQSEDVPNEAFL